MQAKRTRAEIVGSLSLRALRQRKRYAEESKGQLLEKLKDQSLNQLEKNTLYNQVRSREVLASSFEALIKKQGAETVN